MKKPLIEILDDLLREILDDLKTELELAEVSDIKILSSKINNASREVARARNYPDSYSEADIASDMENYYSNIRELALYDFNQVGAEGQTNHSENGYSRTWKSRRECFDGVVAFCKTL